MISFWAYYILSTIILVVIVENALTKSKYEVYQTAISLINSKYNNIIIFNFVGATIFGLTYLLIKFFFGELREIEKIVHFLNNFKILIKSLIDKVKRKII